MEGPFDPSTPDPKNPVLVLSTADLMKAVVSQHSDVKEADAAHRLMEGHHTIVRVVRSGAYEPVEVRRTKFEGTGYIKRKAKHTAVGASPSNDGE